MYVFLIPFSVKSISPESQWRIHRIHPPSETQHSSDAVSGDNARYFSTSRAYSICQLVPMVKFLGPTPNRIYIRSPGLLDYKPPILCHHYESDVRNNKGRICSIWGNR